MVDCPDNGPYVWEQCRQMGCADLAPTLSHFCGKHSASIRLQRPEGCMDAFIEALVQDPYFRLVTDGGPRSIRNLKGAVKWALDEAGVILTMRR